MCLHTIEIESSCCRANKRMVFTATAHVPREGESYVCDSGMPWRVDRVTTHYPPHESRPDSYNILSRVKVVPT